MEVNGRYRQTFHACVPEMWSNDPNGLIYFQGKYHLFYQHYPHATNWGPMHWGHFSTTDFVHWTDELIALVPEFRYEKVCGCCSGSTFEHDGKLWIIYTAAQPDLQRQCYAFSEDGIHFQKYEGNPVIAPSDISDEISVKDFRDPHMFRKDGKWYFLAACRTHDRIGLGTLPYPTESGFSEEASDGGNPPRDDAAAEGRKWETTGAEDEVLADGYGNIVLLRSDDLKKWEYVGKLLYRDDRFPKTLFRLEGAYECPDYITLSGQELLIASPQNLPQNGIHFQNVHSNAYMPGKLDFETGRFIYDDIVEIDSGFDFYAPQTMRTPDGRTILIAWKEMWDRSFPTANDLWAGSYTLPRELDWKNGHLYQYPVREIEQFRTQEVSAEHIEVGAETEDLPKGAPAEAAGQKVSEVSLPGFEGNIYELDIEFAPETAAAFGVKLFKTKESPELSGQSETADGRGQAKTAARHETVIRYDAERHILTFDRAHSGIKITGRDNNTEVRQLAVEPEETLRLRIFVDVSTVEVFVNGGRYTMTGNVYPDIRIDRGISFFAEGGRVRILKAVKYDIEV